VLVIGGSGYLYGGPIGAIFFKIMKDTLSALTPAYWLFWMGFALVILVLVGRDRINIAAERALAPILSLFRRKAP
jgi:branched-chain amino acid transport system permease protein